MQLVLEEAVAYKLTCNMHLLPDFFQMGLLQRDGCCDARSCRLKMWLGFLGGKDQHRFLAWLHHWGIFLPQGMWRGFSICICLISHVPKVPFALSSRPPVCTVHAHRAALSSSCGPCCLMFPGVVSPAAFRSSPLLPDCLSGVPCSLCVTYIAFLSHPEG